MDIDEENASTERVRITGARDRTYINDIVVLPDEFVNTLVGMFKNVLLGYQVNRGEKSAWWKANLVIPGDDNLLPFSIEVKVDVPYAGEVTSKEVDEG